MKPSRNPNHSVRNAPAKKAVVKPQPKALEVYEKLLVDLKAAKTKAVQLKNVNELQAAIASLDLALEHYSSKQQQASRLEQDSPEAISNIKVELNAQYRSLVDLYKRYNNQLDQRISPPQSPESDTASVTSQPSASSSSSVSPAAAQPVNDSLEVKKVKLKKFDKILKQLKRDVDQFVAENKGTEKADKALALYKGLKFIKDYRFSSPDFEKVCINEIDKAKPFLKGEAGWGLKLKNLARSIMQLPISIVTFGTVQFFKPQGPKEIDAEKVAGLIRRLG